MSNQTEENVEVTEGQDPVLEDASNEVTEENKEETAAEVVAEENPTEEVAEETPAAEESTEEVVAETPAEEPKAKKKSSPAPVAEDDDDFDWDEEDAYTPEERARLEKMYEGTLHEVNENEIVTGTVLAVGPKEVMVNIGFKSEGIVPTQEFRDTPDLKPGDEVELFLETVEDVNGQLVLSRKRAKHLRTWELIQRAEKEDIVVEGFIKRRTKGGFVVDIKGVEAFLPGSQIDVKPVRDFDAYVGKTMDFKVVKINYPFENVVISHKVLIEKDLEKQRQEILKNLEKGQVLEGTVKNMTNFGVFIDLGGVDGLLHITDISWGRINHPEEVLELDQKINVVVLDFDDDKKRISLGLKQLQPHPWDSLPEEIVVGSRVKGRVVTVADYGIFLEIMPGVEGLVHASEMTWSQHLKDTRELFSEGDEVEAVVLSIDREERKMSLGVKQTLDDPWVNAAEKFAVRTRHTGIVRNMTNYGLFVELEEGVDGLVHISDLSWTKKFNHPSDFIKREEQLEVVVLDIDVENRRLSLGHKQLTEDVWETFENMFVVGSDHNGTILRLEDKGCIVELEYGIEGFVPRKHMETDKGESKLKVGEKYDFKVIEFNKDSKKLVLSHTHTWKEDLEIEKKPSKGGGGKKRTSVPTPKAEATLLGDLGALQQLKEKMEAEEKKSRTKAKAKDEKAEEKKEEAKESNGKPEAKKEEEAPKAEEEE